MPGFWEERGSHRNSRQRMNGSWFAPTPRKLFSFTRLFLQLSLGIEVVPMDYPMDNSGFFVGEVDSKRHRSGFGEVLSAGTNLSWHLRRNCRGQKRDCREKISCRI